MSTAPLSMTDVVGYVLENADENDLTSLSQAMNSRRRLLQEKAAAAVKPGLEVTIHDISPKYLSGLTGTTRPPKHPTAASAAPW